MAVVLPLLAACSSVEQTYSEFFEEEPMPERVQVDEEELEGGTIPNLSTVPMERPSPTPEQERERLRRSLQEDHERSRIEQPQETPSSDQPGEHDVDSDNTSYLDRKTGNDLAGRLASSEPEFTGVQLAQITVNEDVVTGSARTQEVMQGAETTELAGVIYFRHGSQALDSRDHTIISQIAQAADQEGARVRVVGHASAHTPTMDVEDFQRVNQAMSRKRAESVAQALRQAGLRSSAIEVEARGIDERVYAEFMPTGEAGNRRVEIFLLY
ncbi:OmpA family protein [Fodinicurvata halophila]|uniref:OmpA family protein n=1 Tax=Fodinicurvata halophila TaxID=1419723 RepID=UPI003631B1FC